MEEVCEETCDRALKQAAWTGAPAAGSITETSPYRADCSMDIMCISIQGEGVNCKIFMDLRTLDRSRAALLHFIAKKRFHLLQILPFPPPPCHASCKKVGILSGTGVFCSPVNGLRGRRTTGRPSRTRPTHTQRTAFAGSPRFRRSFHVIPSPLISDIHGISPRVVLEHVRFNANSVRGADRRGQRHGPARLQIP